MTVHAIVQLVHVFDFPYVPFELGMRHIHTPEHLSYTHRLMLPTSFCLTTTHPPSRANSCHIIAFRFKTWFGEQEARMFTDSRDRSSLMVFDTHDRASFLAHLRVEPLGARGHRLTLHADFFTPNLSFFARFLIPYFLNSHNFEDALSWGYTVRRENKHFHTYRRRVLYGIIDLPVEGGEK